MVALNLVEARDAEGFLDGLGHADSQLLGWEEVTRVCVHLDARAVAVAHVPLRSAARFLRHADKWRGHEAIWVVVVPAGIDEGEERGHVARLRSRILEVD